VVVSELPPDTVIYYKAVLEYSGTPVSTTETSTRTNPAPTLSVTAESIYSEGIFLIVQINANGQIVDDFRVEYYTPTSHDWSIARGYEASPNIFHVNITGLTPETPVHFQAVLAYQTHVATRQVMTEESTITTNALPAIQVIGQNVGFDQADILVEIKPNNNPIYASWLEYQFPEISDEWKNGFGTGEVDESFVVHLTHLSPGQTILSRGVLSYATGGEINSKTIHSDDVIIKTNSISTGDSQATYNAKSKTVDYQLSGLFRYTKRTASDFTHRDLGFVWSENSNPVLDSSSHQLSLGGASLPVDDTDASYSFNTTIIGLSTGKTYYFRAYVIGENDVVYYGDVKTCFLPTTTIAPESTTTKETSGQSETATQETTSGETSSSGSDSQPSTATTMATSETGSTSADPTVTQSTSSSEHADQNGFLSGSSPIQLLILGIIALAFVGIAVLLFLIYKKKKT
jgi:hypothetical protein